MSRRVRGLALALVLFVAVWSPAAAQRVRVRFGVGAVGEWGAQAAALGVDWEQMRFAWDAIQPEPDAFETAALDAQVQAAVDAGREVVGKIVDTPGWASESGAASAVPEGLTLPYDDPGNVWGAFVGRLAAHYAPLGVHEWVIYDTPNVRFGEGEVRFAGEVDDYVRLLDVARQAVRAQDPAARIHVAAADWWVDRAAGRTPYVARLAAALETAAVDSRRVFDVVRVRVTGRTGDLDTLLSTTVETLAASGLADTAIWLEANAVPTLDIPLMEVLPVFGVSTGQQADFLVQAAAVGLAAGIERMLVIPLADDHPAGLPGGLLREDGSPRPAFDAYRQVIERFGAAESAARYSDELGELVVIEQAEQDVFVMWARTDAPVRFLVTAETSGEEAELITRSGQRTVTSQATVYPSVYVVDAPGALRDANGFLTVAGSPRILVMPATDFFRVGYIEIDGERFRIR